MFIHIACEKEIEFGGLRRPADGRSDKKMTLGFMSHV